MASTQQLVSRPPATSATSASSVNRFVLKLVIAMMPAPASCAPLTAPRVSSVAPVWLTARATSALVRRRARTFSYRQNRRLGQPNYRRRINFVFVGSMEAHPNTRCSVESAFLSFTEPVDGVRPSDHFGVTVDVEIGHGGGALGHVADPAGDDWQTKLKEMVLENQEQ